MINIEIEDVTGIHKANFNVSKTTWIYGPNGAGKSTIARAIGFVAARQTPGQKDAHKFVRTGAGKGVVTLTTDEGSYSLTLPSRKNNEKGNPLTISKYAAGLVYLPELKPADLSTELQRCIKAEPTKEDLQAWLTRREVPAENTDRAWERIQKYGWDKSLEQYTERGAGLKGQWHQLTGLNFGSDQSSPEKYIPAGWESSFENSSREELEKICAGERSVLENLIRCSAAKEQEFTDLTEVVANKSALEMELGEASDKVKEAETTYRGLMDAVKKVARPDRPQLEEIKVEGNLVECSGCGLHGRVFSGKLQKVDQLPPEEIEAIKSRNAEKIAEFEQKKKISDQEIKDKEKIADEAAAELKKAHTYVAKIEQELKRCRDAQKKLDNLASEGFDADNLASDEDIEKQRKVVERHDAGLKAYVQKTEADQLYRSVMNNQEIIDALKPLGVRGKKLGEALADFNDKLEQLGSIAEWERVCIDENMEIYFGQYPYELLSDGEKMRVKILFQLVLALYEGAPLVVIDKVGEYLDDGDYDGASGLMNILQAVPLKSVVCVKSGSQKKVPNLAAARMGDAFWLDKKTGTLVKLHEPAKAAS